jgi:hypothetical protein
MTPTPWWKSKTIILAILQAIVGVLVVVLTQYPGVGVIAIVKSAIDVLIRVMTDTPIG